MTSDHIPVLLKEVIDGLKVELGKKYIDATVGRGGHTEEILKKGGIVLGIDADCQNIEFLKNSWRKKNFNSKNWKLICANFKNIKSIALESGFSKASGVLFDLGISGWQIEKANRGFSYLKNEPLDMRFNPKKQKVAAADILNKFELAEIAELLEKYAEEEKALEIAKVIVKRRPVAKTRELVEILQKFSNDYRILARVFQALRIAVNEELKNLKAGLAGAVELLDHGGRLTVISFHSLEDRIVKLAMKDKKLKIVTKKPIIASMEEFRKNSRARSAKLRIAEKI